MHPAGCCEPVQQILVKPTNHNEAWITQLPYLCGHNVMYRAGLDKCGERCYSEYHQVAWWDKLTMACDPKGDGRYDHNNSRPEPP